MRTATDETIATYLQQDSRTVPGWFQPTDGWLMTIVAAMQDEEGITGDALEIGAFQGRSAILLAHLLGPQETMVVCDPFDGDTSSVVNDAENDRYYTGLQETSFREHYARFHTRPPEVHVMTSDVYADIAEADRFRLVHVDGSHLYDPVVGDIALTRRAMRAGGLVVFDDVFNGDLPGVAAAVWGAVATTDLVPVAMTEAKLYCAWGDRAGAWVQGLGSRLHADGRFTVEDIPLAGTHVHLVRPTAAIRSPWRSRARKLLPAPVTDAILRAEVALRR